MTAKKRGLGKGLDALLGVGSDVNLASSSESSALKMLAIDLVKRGQHQPRQDFNQDALNTLADSIQPQGVVQPLLVRPVAD